jgi:hypothetical protein
VPGVFHKLSDSPKVGQVNHLDSASPEKHVFFASVVIFYSNPVGYADPGRQTDIDARLESAIKNRVDQRSGPIIE